jgi:ABC-type multidrug transport system ATPase subunit
VKEGDINISTGAGGGVGICPQKNVLWDDLTVEEHVRIWNLIKSRGDDKETLKRLIEECDLTMKRHAKSKTLSGGQKRKLQLAAMFTGGSTICAIDEVSSGLDPLSRRKIWDIILAARGTRTILMTSHFLDEADLLADHIAILSKGHLKCEGSAVQLKTQYGGGYRVHAPISAPSFQGVSMKRFYDKTIYNIPDANQANQLIESLEKSGVSDYYVAGPSIEDVFLK